MKNIVFLFLLMCGLNVFGQDLKVNKPEYVIIANDQIITKDQLTAYGAEGLIKSMQKGVSDEIKDKLAQKFGDKISDSQFIILIDLYTKSERDSLQNTADNRPNETPNQKEDGFKLKVTDNALDFKVQMINGEPVMLSELKGKVVLLDFWATWCAPCIMEFYEIQNEIVLSLQNPNLVFLPISIGENEKTIRKKLQDLKEKGLVLNSGIDTDKTIWDKYASGSIPKSFVIDKNGIVRCISVGNSEENISKMKQTIQQLLTE